MKASGWFEAGMVRADAMQTFRPLTFVAAFTETGFSA